MWMCPVIGQRGHWRTAGDRVTANSTATAHIGVSVYLFFLTICLIDWFLFIFRSRIFITLICRRHHCEGCKLTAFKKGKDFNRATPDVTQELGFCSLLEELSSMLLRNNKGCSPMVPYLLILFISRKQVKGTGVVSERITPTVVGDPVFWYHPNSRVQWYWFWYI